MGMYDEIRCDYPLPGDPPAFVRGAGHRFQTRSLGCTLAAYAITADGRLEAASSGEDSWGGVATGLNLYHGAVEFYNGNAVGSAGGFSFTPGGEDAEWVAYLATFDRGRLAGIVETERTRGPALPVAEMSVDPPPDPTEEDVTNWKAREAESLVGRTMYHAWGTFDREFEVEAVEVVAEGPKEWAIRRSDGRLDLVDRRDRDSMLFDSESDARMSREDHKRRHDHERATWESKLAARSGAVKPRPTTIAALMEDATQGEIGR